MVLARKLLRINREEGIEQGRAEARAELEPVIEKLQEEIRRLRNGKLTPEPEPDEEPTA